MKDCYKIREISRLYNIGTDSLRYYEEIGLLSPKRGENGYRLYTMKDIYKLNVIKELRQLGFSMQSIKEYLDNKSLANTVQLLREQRRLIESEIKSLRTREKSIRSRIAEITGYDNTESGLIEVFHYPARPCVQLKTDATRDEEIDFALNKLHKRFEHKIHLMDNYIVGATLRLRDIERGVFGFFEYVFFILEEGSPEYDFLIPEGEYLSTHYRGSYEQSDEKLKGLLAHAEAAGYKTAGDPFELYKIDMHETGITDEYLTEVQIRIEQQQIETPVDLR